MIRKGLWLSGLGLAALLTISHNAEAGIRVGLRVGPPPWRREVIIERPDPGRAWMAGYRGWDRVRHVWLPGRWIEGRPGHYRADARWRHRHDGRAYREEYWRSR
jgi:hypothetical protein